MTNAITSSSFACGVKKDAMSFILPSFKLTYWVMFLIWYFHCIFSRVFENVFFRFWTQKSNRNLYKKLVFLKFYSLNEEAVRSDIQRWDITLFTLFISLALIYLLEQLKSFLLLLKKCQVSSKLWLLSASTVSVVKS